MWPVRRVSSAMSCCGPSLSMMTTRKAGPSLVKTTSSSRQSMAERHVLSAMMPKAVPSGRRPITQG